jgi:peptide/nickel transport system substrate-binding protein
VSVAFRRFPYFVATLVVLILAFSAAWFFLRPTPIADRTTDLPLGATSDIVPGGSLVGSVRAEPRSFNRWVMNGQTEETVAFLTQSKLVRINRVTDQVEPWLAESWQEVSRQSTVDSRQSSVDTRQSSVDSRQSTVDSRQSVSPQSSTPDPQPSTPGPTYRFRLRQGVTFSDGARFTSADVLFAFEAIYDQRTGSTLASALRIGGRPLTVRALGDYEVEISYPSPYGAGVRLLDALWILPKHKLEPALRAGTLGQSWNPTTDPADIAALGPFVLREYRPGERMVFERNPRYWRKDDRGRQLPYLDRLTLEILPDQAAELLRLQSGQLDFTHSAVRPEDYLTLKRAQDEGRAKLVDLGISLDPDWFWFNLATSPQPSALSLQPSAPKPWLRAREFRQAISLAVDRKAYVEQVFLGAAVPVHGPITPGNTTWYWPELPGGNYDPARARMLLAGLGLRDSNGDGTLEDAQGTPVRLTVILQRGIAAVERGAAFIRDALANVGVGLDTVGVDAGTVQARWAKGDYEVIFHRMPMSATDPSPDFWFSSGALHVWRPAQAMPATAWEKEIDALMVRQSATSDQQERVQLFREVQKIFSEHSPVLCFAAQQLFLATSARLTNATPSRLIPLILWSADTLAVDSSPR